MTVFLGNYGRVELQRRSARRTMRVIATDSSRDTFTLAPEGGAASDLFSRSFITGDRVRLTPPTGQTFSWITGNPSGAQDYFLHVDQIGSIRLYTSLAASLQGELSNAVPLEANNNVNMVITVESLDTTYRVIALVTSYELSTSREAIDGTALSEEFRSQYSGLMSGSGRLNCIWDYTSLRLGNNVENVNYLLQLVTRTQIGGEFSARFYLKTEGYNPSNSTDTTNDSLYYEVNGIITNAAVAFQLDSKVEAAIDFVATGQIQLKIETTPIQNLVIQDGANLNANAQGERLGANPAV